MAEATTDMVCGECAVPLNAFRPFANPTAVEWRHPGTGEANHPPRPVPRDQVPRVRQVCDFCSAPARVVFRTRESIEDIRAEPTFTGREQRRRIGRHWQAVTAEQAEPIETQRNQYSDGWASCSRCAVLVDQRDMERLITRLRRLRPEVFAAVPRNALRDLYRPVFHSIIACEPIPANGTT
jgi:hypothetical protein